MYSVTIKTVVKFTVIKCPGENDYGNSCLSLHSLQAINNCKIGCITRNKDYE